MSVREHNEMLMMKFLDDGAGGHPSDAPFWFRGKVVLGIDEALELLGDDFKIYAMDRKTINNNIHAAPVDNDKENLCAQDPVSKT